MAVKRILTIGAASLFATVVVATTAQAAYTAYTTLYGTSAGQISTIDCRAAVTASTADDSARTIEVEGEKCSSVSVKIFYSNSVGYAGWSNTVTHASKAVKDLSGADQLQRSYHTASR